MEQTIRDRARELGFDACRFTSAAAPETAGALHRWLAAGWHGEMAYMARKAAQRADPQLVLAGARSVMVLAASYHRDERAEDGGLGAANRGQRIEGRDPRSQVSRAFAQRHGPAAGGDRRCVGVIARYARSADYHTVLGERLEELTKTLNTLGGSDTRSLGYVDTGPILERDLAQRAGLGFIGKHTNLIGRSLGNWFFLSEILTTLELKPDPPERNRCGSCARCLAACPTTAIRAPFQLDARRCISYLTLELKGAIPTELRPLIGNRICGCDDCLAVCPWNRFAQEGRLMKPQAREDREQPDLLELLRLDEAGFRQRFAGTPIWRTKRRGFLRNVCIALGNVGDDRALPALGQATCDPEPLIAEPACWAIVQIQQRLARPAPASGQGGCP